MGLLRSLQENPYTERIASSPLLSVLSSIVAICVINRLVTGLQGTIAQNNRDAEKKVPSRIAYWFPWVGSAKVFVKNLENMISQDRDNTGDGVFSYRIGPTIYYIVNMPSLVQQVFAQRGQALNKQKVLEWFMKTAFDDKWATRNEHDAFHGHHTALNLMLKEDFINEATGKTARTVEVESARLVTSPPWAMPDSEKGLELWEEAGNVKFNADGSFEADFYKLIVHYMGQIVIDMLWGKALIKNHPNLQTDMWEFDEGVHHLVAKIKAIMPAGRRAIAARSRLFTAMQEWHEAVAAKQSGRDPGAKWGALDDISQIMQDRVRVWVDHHASEILQRTNDVSVIWGVNVNSNKVVFWMLLQIYTRPELLSDIRDEISEYVKPSPSGERGPTGFPKLEIDVEGLTKRCPLIKATFHETMRMNMSGLGIRQVIRDITIKESAADAAMFGKKRPQAYTIPAGSTLVLANGTMQMDQRIFESPEEFRPERFIEEGPDGNARVHMKNLNTFGGGLYKCKGRYFAEKEVLIFAAGILAMWDVGSTETGQGEDIAIPEMGTAGASRSPKKDVRVRLVRRYN